jgi:hypothetical protein
MAEMLAVFFPVLKNSRRAAWSSRASRCGVIGIIPYVMLLILHLFDEIAEVIEGAAASLE